MALAVTVGTTANTSSSSTTLPVPYPASVAVGDLLLMHLTLDQAIPGTPSGWTLTETNNRGGNLFAYVYQKIAVSGDVGQANLSVTTLNGQSGGVMYRITGHDPVTPVAADTSGVSTTQSFSFTGVTPSKVQSLIMIMASSRPATTATCSSYAIATSSPSFSEHYDFQWNTNNYQMSGASGTRASAAATGNFSGSFSDGNSNACFLVVVSVADESNTVTPAALSLTATQVDTSLAISQNPTAGVQSLTATQSAPTTNEYSTSSFDNPSKSSTSWVNPDKS